MSIVSTAEPESLPSLAEEIRLKRGTGEPSHAFLKVDQRVLARITDGIYRRPSSAFRELISNAYDADATQVVIQTDAPRFNRIVISDNGRGMSPEALDDLVHHIGGSSKRTSKGRYLETVDPKDSDLSPGGRRLIGKIGIGLFSVAQLSQHFQIITKRKGDDYRTSADVVLRTYSEEDLKEAGGEVEFETGEVVVTSIPAPDVESQGTDIIIMDLRIQAQETLRSFGRWSAAHAAEEEGGTYPLPKYHIGEITTDPSLVWTVDDTDSGASSQSWHPEIYATPPALPWNADASPVDKFRQLFQAVRGEANVRRNPAVEESLDEYLATLWRLSLAVPLDYIEKHPFDLTSQDGIAFFRISEKPKGTAEPITLANGETVGQHLGLTGTHEDPCGGFRVLIDDVELRRPIAFDGKLHARSTVTQPLMFFGQARSNLGSYPASLGGGRLSFDGYLYWNSRIIPKENNGVLVRINRASGVLFDETFMDYQVSELNRLAQITSEIFITEGLDPALNIDRESFNFSHPHYQWVQRWLHAAVKQTTNKLKGLTKSASDASKKSAANAARTDLALHAADVWRQRQGEDADQPPDIRLVDDGDQLDLLGSGQTDTVVLNSSAVLALAGAAGTADTAEDRVKALVTVLEAYSLLEKLTRHEQEQLVKDILKIFSR